MRHASSDETMRIKEILAKPREEKTADEVAYIRQLMDLHGSIAYAEEQAKLYAEQAMDKLSTIDFIADEHYADLFRSMVHFILERGK